MTRLGFALLSDSCIGCHACTVACKSEHDVPLGVNRTWVKYIETGEFPNTGRSFSVMRCNHCDDAPCMTICPTSALHRTPNGIVDFDDSRCIGCKACMQACPYDAIYINPETNTAHKCNFCTHRIEVGLEPACVVVCPTHAIVTGDLDDPNSAVSKIVARDKTAVRAPEQGTNPKVFYRGVDQASLDPTRTVINSDGMIWAETTPSHPTLSPTQVEHSGEGIVARTAYTTAHHMTWKSMVSGYLVTKAIAAGLMLIAALLVVLGHGSEQAAVGIVPPVLAGVFIAATGALLIGDLKQPGRFLFILTKSNTTSWLVRGAWILGAFAGVAALWGLLGILDQGDVFQILALPIALLAGRRRRVHGLPVRTVRGPRSLADAVVAADSAGPGGRRRRCSILPARSDHGHPRGACDPDRVPGRDRWIGAADRHRAVVEGLAPRRTGNARDDPRSLRQSVLVRRCAERSDRSGRPADVRARRRHDQPVAGGMLPASLHCSACSPTKTPTSVPASPCRSLDRVPERTLDMTLANAPAARSLARLDRTRRQGVARTQGAQLHDRSDHLLQL